MFGIQVSVAILSPRLPAFLNPWLLFFIEPSAKTPCLRAQGDETHLVAPLPSPVWQNKNRTSFNVCENAYLADIFWVYFSLDRSGYRRYIFESLIRTWLGQLVMALDCLGAGRSWFTSAAKLGS